MAAAMESGRRKPLKWVSRAGCVPSSQGKPRSGAKTNGAPRYMIDLKSEPILRLILGRVSDPVLPADTKTKAGFSKRHNSDIAYAVISRITHDRPSIVA